MVPNLRSSITYEYILDQGILKKEIGIRPLYEVFMELIPQGRMSAEGAVF
jgi:hypothetical protein